MNELRYCTIADSGYRVLSISIGFVTTEKAKHPAPKNKYTSSANTFVADCAMQEPPAPLLLFFLFRLYCSANEVSLFAFWWNVSLVRVNNESELIFWAWFYSFCM